MTEPNHATANGSNRRLLLVDFDWQDADLLPELLQHPGVSVRLVAGVNEDDAGMRLAELCGLPRTLDLADLTREIFDLALVSERSPRRQQIEGLLLALGTPSVTPRSFLTAEQAAGAAGLAEGPVVLTRVPFEASVASEDLGALLEQALPDVSIPAPDASEPPTTTAAPAPARAGDEAAPSRPAPEPAAERPGVEVPAVAEPASLPDAQDRAGLEAWLRSVMRETGAVRAVLRLSAPGRAESLVEVGPADALLESLEGLARQLGGPQVVGGLTGHQAGKAWGAWPIRTLHRHGLISAGGIAPVASWTAWERAAAGLRAHWDRRERELAAPAFPFLPERYPRWLDAEDFGTRLELAVERNRRDGLRFFVHRLAFAGPEPVVAALFDRLPVHLRDMDCLTRPTPNCLLVLTAATPEGFGQARARMALLWEQAWAEAGQPQPAPEPDADVSQLSGPADEAAFLETARGWSAAR